VADVPVSATSAASLQSSTTGTIPWNANALLPSGVPSYAQSLAIQQFASSMRANLQTPLNVPAASANAAQISQSPDATSSVPLPAINPGSQSVAQQAASTWLHQMMGTGASPGTTTMSAAPPNVQTGLPPSVSAFMQAGNIAAPQMFGAAPTNPASNPLLNQQQAAASWLQNMATPGAPSFSASITPARPIAQPNPAGNPMLSPQQAAASWLQRMSSPALASGTASVAPTTPAAPASGTPQAAPSQTSSALLQQILAANAQVAASVSAAYAPHGPLPQGVASYAQGLSQSGSAPAQQLSEAAQPTTSANGVAANAATAPAAIPGANTGQSVAAMFSVPAFPAAMAFGTAKAQPNSNAANSDMTAKAQPLAALPNAPLPATGSANPTPAAATSTAAQAAQADIGKAAILAQAAQDSVRSGHTAPVTEAQSLPLHFDLNSTVSDMKDANAHASSTKDVAAQSASIDAPATPKVSAPPLEPAPSQRSADLSAAVSSAAAETTPSQAAPATTGFAAQAQPASAQPAAQTASPLPPAPPAAPVAAPDLNALAINIAAKSQEGARQFDIRLDPAELGRVDVRLSLDGNGTAQAHLSAERPETLSLLQSNAPALTRALQDSGVHVANDGLQFSLKGQDRQSDGQPRTPSRSRASAVQSIAASASLGAAPSTYGLSPSGAGVNILV
jgi:flagellar hook-length control protein FliK